MRVYHSAPSADVQRRLLPRLTVAVGVAVATVRALLDRTARMVNRTDGDTTRAREVLGWEPSFDDLQTIVATALAWEKIWMEKQGA